MKTKTLTIAGIGILAYYLLTRKKQEEQVISPFTSPFSSTPSVGSGSGFTVELTPNANTTSPTIPSYNEFLTASTIPTLTVTNAPTEPTQTKKETSKQELINQGYVGIAEAKGEVFPVKSIEEATKIVSGMGGGKVYDIKTNVGFSVAASTKKEEAIKPSGEPISYVQPSQGFINMSKDVTTKKEATTITPTLPISPYASYPTTTTTTTTTTKKETTKTTQPQQNIFTSILTTAQNLLTSINPFSKRWF